MLTETVSYAIAPDVLRDKIALALDGLASSVNVALGEVTALVPASSYLQAAQICAAWICLLTEMGAGRERASP